MKTRAASMLRVGLIGAGRWGVNYLRALPATAGVELTSVFDLDADALARARRLAPEATAAADLASLLALVDAVVIATPMTTHAELALHCLDAGKHVLVEKPLSTDVASAVAVIARAEANARTLFVGHLTLCNPSLVELRRLLMSGAVGPIERIDVVRTSNGARHRRESALWSLGPHDIANVLFVSGSTPTRVRDAWAQGLDEAGVELELSSGAIARMRWSRSSPAPERRLVVQGALGSLIFDEQTGTLQLSREGEVSGSSPTPSGGLLDWQCAQFVEAVRDPALAGTAMALQVVRVLAASQATLERAVPAQKLSATV